MQQDGARGKILHALHRVGKAIAKGRRDRQYALPDRHFGKDTIHQMRGSIGFHETWHQPRPLPLTDQKGLEMTRHQAIEDTLFRPARTVLASGFADGEVLIERLLIAGAGQPKNGCEKGEPRGLALALEPRAGEVLILCHFDDIHGSWLPFWLM